MISICMPTLNSEAFMTSRLESIRRQTYTDWELVVVDSQSDDATLPMIEAFAEQGGVVRVYQGPRDGIYTNINRSIEYAQGEYVYIATSDDTMADDCLEKLAKALDRHPGCGLAHCPLKILDANDESIEDDWWSDRSSFVRSAGGLLHQTHLRKAPYDGMLHMLGQTVYTSLTQLLIRRELFDRIGMFRSDWGPIGDFYWDMRAALTMDTIHVGDTWASWRVHETQATVHSSDGKSRNADKIDAMIEQALKDADQDLPEAVRTSLASWQDQARQLRHFLSDINAADSRVARWAYLTGQLLKGAAPARRYVLGKLGCGAKLPEEGPKIVEGWLRSAGQSPVQPDPAD